MLTPTELNTTAATQAATDGGVERGPLLGLNAGDVLTITQAARALRMRETDARAWLRDQDLIRTVAGRERVIWGDALATIRRGDAPKPEEKPGRGARSGSLPRMTL